MYPCDGPFNDGRNPLGRFGPDPGIHDESDPGTLVGIQDGALTVLYAPDGNSRMGGAGSGAGGSAATTQTAAIGTSPFVINITWDSSVSAAPAEFKPAVLNAVQYLESQFSDAVTVNIAVGYGEVDGTPLESGTLGASQSMLSGYNYNSLVSALTTDAASPADMTAVASLLSTPPSGGTFWTTTAGAKALGLSRSTAGTDGYIGFSSETPWTYGNTAGVAPGTYDFNGIVLHELTEVMGRILFTGTRIAGIGNSYSLVDLFHYQAAGVRNFSAGMPSYFSADGGATSLGAFNTVPGGDPGDWASSATNDSFDAFASSDVVNPVSASDLSVVDVIGWNRAPAVSSASISAPEGASLTVTPADKASGLIAPDATTGGVTASGASDAVNVATLVKALGTSTPTSSTVSPATTR